ncbi:TetR/AcrR family transcriptional regulator [Demequina aurantiaca]|uniref:TetR/AcrR family transcriptional regulator n=1 Tax=Demequina aurantiaca TaxID=676200 RepID=UPI000783D104|nr:TetR/AcrR family transcriptional regulator [Demequina aurantiaca]
MPTETRALDTRTAIVQATFDLTLANGAVPSLDAVVRASGVSKGGLLHHFPTRVTLLRGLAQWLGAKSIAWFDDLCEQGSAIDAWLAASTPKSEEMNEIFVLFTTMQALRAAGETGDSDYGEFTAHVDRKIAEELAGPDAEQRALLIRLVGDGLFFASLLGSSVPEAARLALSERLAAPVPS